MKGARLSYWVAIGKKLPNGGWKIWLADGTTLYRYLNRGQAR